MALFFEELANFDPAVAAACADELTRQRQNIELIASENIVSRAVLLAAGGVLTNKYAEGYPGKRYYGGCRYVDVVEDIARERACRLFGADHANVQPHSGANANLAVFFALLQPGDTVMGMDLSQGGHLSHGSPVNISGKYFHVVSYGVDPATGMIDYDEVRRIALENRPKLLIAGASAYSRTIDFARFRQIADEVGAYLMVDMAHIAAKAVALGEALTDEFKTYQHGIVQNARALCDALLAEGIDIVSGGTDNHLMLLDLTRTGVTGKELEHRLDEVHITANKNAIPNDPQSPFITSGLRVGTPAVTTRGFGTAEMKDIARWISLALSDFEGSRDQIAEGVQALCARFPIYE